MDGGDTHGSSVIVRTIHFSVELFPTNTPITSGHS